MKVLGIIAVIMLMVLSVFTLANWTTLTAPTSLSLLVFTVEGPLGVILLGVTLLFTALFAAYALAMRTSMLVEARRHAKELHVQRDLAENAEASRLDSLRVQIRDGFIQSRAALEESVRSLISHTESIEEALLKSFEEATNSLSAYMGEVDDKLDRALQRRVE